MSATKTRPHVVLIPGANCQPQNYRQLSNCLSEAGYPVSTPVLPTDSGKRPATYADDVRVVRETLSRLVEQGKNVLMLMHSYGGLVASSAVKSLSLREREANNQLGGVVHLIYLSAYMVREGQSVMDIIALAGFTDVIPQVIDFRQDGTCVPFRPSDGIFADLPKDTQREQIDLMVPFATAGFDGKATYAAWKDNPSTYIYSSKDMWVPPVYQDIFLKQAQEDGAHVSVERYDVGHAMHAKDPEAVVQIVERVAASASQ